MDEPPRTIFLGCFSLDPCASTLRVQVGGLGGLNLMCSALTPKDVLKMSFFSLSTSGLGENKASKRNRGKALAKNGHIVCVFFELANLISSRSKMFLEHVYFSDFLAPLHLLPSP